MKKHAGALLLVIFLTFSVPDTYAIAFDFHPTGFRPVTDPGRIVSLYNNPAGLGFLTGINLNYSHSHRPDIFSRNKSFAFGAGHLGIGMEYLGQELPYNYRRYSIGYAGNTRNIITWGGAYRWVKDSGKGPGNFHQWDCGLLIRPVKYFSVGLLGENLNRPKTLSGTVKPKYTGGLAIRPMDNLITLSGQFSMRDGDDLDQAGTCFSIELNPLDGFSLGMDFADHGRIGFSLCVNSVFGSSTVYSRVGKEGDLLERISDIEISSKAHTGIRPNPVSFLKIQIDSDIIEENRGRKKLFNKNRSLLDILTTIRRAAEDSGINGIFLEIQGLNIGKASIQELRRELISFKKHNKTVVAFAKSMSGNEYYLATAADKIYMVPSGYLNLTGIRAEITYFKGLMDKLGIEAEIITTGDYKSAGETLTRENISDANREQLNELLDEIYGRMTIDMASMRDMSVSQMIFTIDQGPFTNEEARAKKLIDGLIYSHQIKDELRHLTGKKIYFVNMKYYDRTEPCPDIWGPLPEIAIVYATGGITGGKSSSGGFMASYSCGAETIAGALRTAANNPRVKAIVLRVDSPGGELTASDIILTEVERARKNKPVIVSMGDVAASGGYYISCKADRIFAEHSTITGSIGVIAGKVIIKGLYDKLGLNKEIITRGKNAALFSTYTYPTDKQREKVTEQIWDYYNTFLRHVSEGRGISIETADSLGQGRVWAGKKAIEIGLVDEYGGLMDAIEEAKFRGNINGEYELAIYPEYPGWISPKDLIISDFAEALERFGVKDIPEALPLNGYYYLMPFHIDIK